MKTISLILFYLASFAGFFFVISIFGMLWHSYAEVITSPGWFIGYSIFLGWWLAALPCAEYWKRNKAYFEVFTMFA